LKLNWATPGKAIALCVFTLCASLSASASILNTPTAHYSTTGEISVNGELDQFDPSLGTLTHITIFSLNGAQSMNTHVANFGEGNVFENAEFGLFSRVNLPGDPGISLFQLIGDNSCASNIHEFNSCDNVQFFSQTGQTNFSFMNASFAPFIGTGKLPFTVDVLQSINLLSQSANNGTREILSDASSGDIFLEYTYTPAEVTNPTPEPATMSIFGGGLILLAISGARRRSRSK
jgi:hypothetical protein